MISHTVAARKCTPLFIIRKDIEKEFKEAIGNRITAICSAHDVTVDYAFQDINDIPGTLKCPIKDELICQMIMIALIINVETLQSYLLSAIGIIIVVSVYREPLLNAYNLFAKRKIKN